MARHDVEQLVAEVSKALNQVEQGWRKAIEKIAERASLIKRSLCVVVPGESVNFTQGTTG